MIPNEQPASDNAPSGWRQSLGSIEAAAVAGLVAATGWAFVMSRLLTVPDVGAPEAEIVRFYADPSRGSDVSWILQVLFVSTAGFLWFIGVIRNRIRSQGHRLFDTVFFGGGIALVMLMFTGAAALAAPFILAQAGASAIDPGSAAMTRAVAHILLAILAPRMAALVVLSSSSLGLRTGVLPRWLTVSGYIVGLWLVLDVTFSEPSVYVFPAWIALVSIVLLLKPRRESPSEPDIT